jgi:hypothetical protein
MQDNQSENTEKRNPAAHLREFRWKPGQSGNLKGRPAGKSLKEYSREYLAKMTDEERMEFMGGLNKVDIWKMAEGNPETKSDITSDGKAINFILNDDLNKSDEISPDTKESSTE